ncbi:hypothetical protein M7I_5023 [Glarea lozoyensis 74030]|uniref:Uncharacterized protein n=1 Tax=Glarea lozoyensis (strain ATCC 74030 / MF5533) TaxID=1104152 RepID=H0EQR8_GLAL7|nr:hypothetical protein M7I_5023 [Glarea lozoyensis 74030]
MFSPKGKGPYKNAFALGTTRAAATFTPSVLTPYTWWTKLLHSTKYGVRMMQAFWGTVDEEARKEANFEGRENLQGFEKLAPHGSIFWQNGTGGLLNHEDFFDTVASGARIYSADVVGLEKGKVVLSTGESLDSDVILCGTGWVPSIKFFTEEQRRQLGLPHSLSSVPAEESDHWSQLEKAADLKVVTKFPQLGDPPAHYHHLKNDRSIVFIGQIIAGNYFPGVQCQAMWATAYMDNKLELPSREEQEKDVALLTTWCRRRYLSSGEEGHNITFELFGYTDGLLETLGLTSHKKGWFKNLFASIFAKDFVGLKDEYVRKYGCDEE